MASKDPYALEPATQEELDAALRPFIERFVPAEKRDRATSLFLPLRKRATVRNLVDIIDQRAVIELDGSTRSATALARIAAGQEGVYLVGKPAVFRTTFGVARNLGAFAYGDEEAFIATGGGCALVTFDVGNDWLIARA